MNTNHKVPSSKFQVQSTKYKVPSTKFKIPSSKFQVQNKISHPDVEFLCKDNKKNNIQ